MISRARASSASIALVSSARSLELSMSTFRSSSARGGLDRDDRRAGVVELLLTRGAFAPEASVGELCIHLCIEALCALPHVRQRELTGVADQRERRRKRDDQRGGLDTRTSCRARRYVDDPREREPEEHEAEPCIHGRGHDVSRAAKRRCPTRRSATSSSTRSGEVTSMPARPAPLPPACHSTGRQPSMIASTTTNDRAIVPTRDGRNRVSTSGVTSASPKTTSAAAVAASPAICAARFPRDAGTRTCTSLASPTSPTASVSRATPTRSDVASPVSRHRTMLVAPASTASTAAIAANAASSVATSVGRPTGAWSASSATARSSAPARRYSRERPRSVSRARDDRRRGTRPPWRSPPVRASRPRAPARHDQCPSQSTGCRPTATVAQLTTDGGRNVHGACWTRSDLRRREQVGCRTLWPTACGTCSRIATFINPGDARSRPEEHPGPRPEVQDGGSKEPCTCTRWSSG